MSIDLVFCKALLNSEDISKVKMAGVEEDILFDEGKKAYLFIERFLRRHGKFPDVGTVEVECGVKLPEAPEPLDFYLEKILTRGKGNLVSSGVKKAIVQLEKGNPDSALDEIKDFIRKTQKRFIGTSGHYINLVDSTEDRKKAYEDLENGVIPEGIPTPWPSLNDTIQGLHGGEFVTLVALTSVGKTSLLLAMAHSAWKSGKKVLVVAAESAPNLLARRIDAIEGRLSYEDFKRGKLGAYVKSKYFLSLDSMKGKQDFVILGKKLASKVVSIEMWVEQLSADIVFIDGVYLLDTKAKSDTWERMTNVVHDLTDLAITKNVPVVVSTQFNRKVDWKSKTGKPSNIAYSDAVGWDSHIVLALFRDADMETSKEALLRLIKARESAKLDLVINFDYSSMDFSEVGPVTEEDLR